MTGLPHWFRFSPISRRLLPCLVLACACSLSPVALSAQDAVPQPAANTNPNTWSQEDALRIVGEVQKRLSNMSNYTVWDWITFGIQGKTIVLRGFASRPVVKSEAGNLVKKIPGVEGVDNEIQVLPLSTMDDRVRGAVYTRIYTYPPLRIYNANQGGIMQAIGPMGRSGARISGGIVNYPPRGFNAIHIIVKNGHVTLYGVVNNENDKTVAGIQANSTPGVFSVDNDLMVANSAGK